MTGLSSLAFARVPSGSQHCLRLGLSALDSTTRPSRRVGLSAVAEVTSLRVKRDRIEIADSQKEFREHMRDKHWCY